MNKDWVTWLETSLGVNHVELSMLTPDASQRRYYRVSNSAQKSLGILCVEEPFNRNEHGFLRLQKVWSQGGIQVPEILDVNEKLGLILQTDLGDVSLQSYLSRSPRSWDQISCQISVINSDARYQVSELIIRDIVKIQNLDQVHFKLKFDKSKFGFEWGWTWQHLIEPHLSDHEIKNVIVDWQHETLRISSALENHIAVPTHRDLHSRNIMMVGNLPAYIDFQDGRLGTQYYDLVSLLFDSYLPFDSKFEVEMREKFSALINIPLNYEIYFLQVIQRTLKACGSFASFKKIKDDSRYQGYIRPTLLMTKHAINSIKRSCKLPGLESIVNLLIERDFDD
jgi:hypothetical protein